MKICMTGIIFSLAFSAAAKPGESYILTGREKSVFGIFQADLKAYPNLYNGEDVNAYYQSFKDANNLGERKLQLGEELIFPDTPISKQIREAEAAKAAKEAEDAAAKAQTKEMAAHPTPTQPPHQPSSGRVTLFGSDTRSPAPFRSPEEEQTHVESQRKTARHKAIYYYQHTLLPHYMFDYNRNIVENIEKGNIDILIEQALEQVDEQFAKALVLHTYSDKKIYVLEFENPGKVGEFFFFAIKREENGRVGIFSMEKGINFFGTGDESVLHEWQSSREFSNLGGRKYKDLTSFIKELENDQSE